MADDIDPKAIKPVFYRDAMLTTEALQVRASRLTHTAPHMRPRNCAHEVHMQSCRVVQDTQRLVDWALNISGLAARHQTVRERLFVRVRVFCDRACVRAAQFTR